MMATPEKKLLSLVAGRLAGVLVGLQRTVMPARGAALLNGCEGQGWYRVEISVLRVKTRAGVL